MADDILEVGAVLEVEDACVVVVGIGTCAVGAWAEAGLALERELDLKEGRLFAVALRIERLLVHQEERERLGARRDAARRRMQDREATLQHDLGGVGERDPRLDAFAVLRRGVERDRDRLGRLRHAAKVFARASGLFVLELLDDVARERDVHPELRRARREQNGHAHGGGEELGDAGRGCLIVAVVGLHVVAFAGRVELIGLGGAVFFGDQEAREVPAPRSLTKELGRGVVMLGAGEGANQVRVERADQVVAHGGGVGGGRHGSARRFQGVGIRSPPLMRMRIKL